MRRALLLLTLMAACGTPQERCIQGATRDLRVVDRLITTSEGNLRRGYALEEVTISRTVWVNCPAPPAPPVAIDGTDTPRTPRTPQLCLDDRIETTTRPKAINLRTEAETLASLKAKRTQLLRGANASITQCKAEFPET